MFAACLTAFLSPLSLSPPFTHPSHSLSLSLIHSLHSHFLTLMRCHCRIAPFLTAKYAEAVRRAHVFCVDEPTKIAAPSLNHENGRLHEHRALAARCCTHAAPTPSPRSSSISWKAAARSESGDLQAKDECPEDRHQTDASGDEDSSIGGTSDLVAELLGETPAGTSALRALVPTAKCLEGLS